MNSTLKTVRRTGVVLSVATAAMIVSAVGNAGPGCMSNQPMGQGYYPYSPMGPQMVYGQRAPYPYYRAPAPRHGMMAAPYNQTMPAPQRSGAVVASRDTPAAVVANTVTSGQTTAGSDTMAAGETVTVRISGMRFEPASITVKPGTTVTWIHESSMPHTVSSQSGGPSSSTLYNGQSFSHTFDTAGRYDYLCGLHPSMKGSVMVEGGALDS